MFQRSSHCRYHTHSHNNWSLYFFQYLPLCINVMHSVQTGCNYFITCTSYKDKQNIISSTVPHLVYSSILLIIITLSVLYGNKTWSFPLREEQIYVRTIQWEKYTWDTITCMGETRKCMELWLENFMIRDHLVKKWMGFRELLCKTRLSWMMKGIKSRPLG